MQFIRVNVLILFSGYTFAQQSVIIGELKTFHKTTLAKDALILSEAPATNLDYRMNIYYFEP